MIKLTDEEMAEIVWLMDDRLVMSISVRTRQERRLIAKAQLKKVWLSWTETPHRILETKKGRYGLDCDDVRVFWEELLKEVGE